jgi:hypothetical protein
MLCDSFYESYFLPKILYYGSEFTHNTVFRLQFLSRSRSLGARPKMHRFSPKKSQKREPLRDLSKTNQSPKKSFSANRTGVKILF